MKNPGFSIFSCRLQISTYALRSYLLVSANVTKGGSGQLDTVWPHPHHTIISCRCHGQSRTIVGICFLFVQNT